ncbi:hypothetical protein NHX12_003338 [Muraenolepis orangiensis]|uniref:Uncharacterized protein n=1 Tax=Muraenolepis orangiensis TaxID=630683 RepID=A0A9Q0IGD5_9TELE|nr:hypothetical protein NHX12_003338 [Muraenolepis orangiensis]
MFTSVRVLRLSNANLTNQSLNKIFTDVCENLLKSLYFKLRSMIPCCLCHVNFAVAVPEEDLIQVAVTAVAMTFDKDQVQEKLGDKAIAKGAAEHEDQLQFPMELCAETASSAISNLSAKFTGVSENASGPSRVAVVKMTPLSFLPGTRLIKYLGIINMFFIRETTSLREVFAMVRAHVAALGGNAVVSYSMKECVFMENPNKNQAQCLINVSGDAVVFVRDADQEATPPLINSGPTSCVGTDGTACT